MSFFDFAKREQKASAVSQALVLNPGQAAWSKRDYANFADEAYTKNVVAHRAISAIANAVASVHWTVWRNEKELGDHPLMELIANPNPMQSKVQYMQAKVGFLLLAGNGYEERIELRGEVRELYQLRPDRVKIVQGSPFPTAYEYRVGGKVIRFDVDPVKGDSDVRHLRFFHPIDDWYGLSPVEAGAYAIDQHNESMTWMQSLLQNSARPSGALTVDGTLQDDTYNRLKNQIEEQYTGGRNAGRPMLLEGGVSWESMGLSPQNMDLLENKFSAARDVALAFGVPPQLLGIKGDNTYSNYAEARLAFWEDTVIPILELIAADWNAWLAGPQNVTLKPDLDQIPAIAEKRQKLWAMADKSTDLTINERRELKGYEPLAEGGDVLQQARTNLVKDADTKAAALLAGYDVKATG